MGVRNAVHTIKWGRPICMFEAQGGEGEGETDSLAVAAAAGKKAIVEMKLTDRSTAVITHLQ